MPSSASASSSSSSGSSSPFPGKPKPAPASVRQIQQILNRHGARPPLPLSGILDRRTIVLAAIYAKSPLRGPELIPLVLARHQAR